MSVPRFAGAVTALLAAWSLVAALLVLGTAALALLVFPTAGVLALVVGVAALAVPGLLAAAAFALLTSRPDGPAVLVGAAVVSVVVAAVGVVGPGLPGHPGVVALIAVVTAVVVVGRVPLVVPAALRTHATVGCAVLLAADGLATVLSAPLAAATPGVIALVTAGIAAWAWRAPAAAAGSLTTAAATLSLLLTVLAVQAGVDPLPAAVALGMLGSAAAAHALTSVRTPTLTRMPLARRD